MSLKSAEVAIDRTYRSVLSDRSHSESAELINLRPEICQRGHEGSTNINGVTVRKNTMNMPGLHEISTINYKDREVILIKWSLRLRFGSLRCRFVASQPFRCTHVAVCFK